MAMALLNCVLISLGTNEAIGKEYSTVLSVCGKTVLAVFLLEILLKLCSGFWKFWKVLVFPFSGNMKTKFRLMLVHAYPPEC